MNSIAIIGAGWLGLPVAQQLRARDCSVFATRTTPERVKELQDLSIPHFVLSLQPDASSTYEASVTALIQRKIKTVIGAFPPGFRKNKGDAYAKQWQLLVDICLKAGVQKLVMVSSTSVYPDTNKTMIESDATLALSKANNGFSENSQIMLQAEQAVIDSGINYAILRCSGLFGPSRHPARFVSKLTSISTLAPANMLHQEDAVNAVIHSLEHINNDVVNITSPVTVSKAEFYQHAIDTYDASLQISGFNKTPAKRINADKLLSTGFHFRFNNVLDGLNYC